MKRILNTIQKREKLNTVMAVDEPGNGGANHHYVVQYEGAEDEYGTYCAHICFQNGPRKDPNADGGVLDTDLLEIVRDRLKGFQSGEFASDYNGQALLHVEEALMWLNRRVEDRIERQVLGTNNK